MSNTKRPSAQRVHTRTSEKARSDELDQGLTVSVDGSEYTVRAGDLTSMDTMALRRETGFSFIGLMRAVQSDPDIDLIAALVWLSRRIDGEKMLSYEAVASEINYDVDVDVIELAEPETDPQP